MTSHHTMMQARANTAVEAIKEAISVVDEIGSTGKSIRTTQPTSRMSGLPLTPPTFDKYVELHSFEICQKHICKKWLQCTRK